MEQLIVALQTAWSLANEAQRKHTEQINAMQAAWEMKLAQDRAELLEDYEKRITDLKRAHEIDTEALNDDFKLLKEQSQEAMNLFGNVEVEKAGVLDTSTLPKRLLFEKLAGRWESLSASDLQMIEEVLDGKVVVL